MKQLAGDDSIFLSIETPNSALTTGAIAVIDPSQAEDFSFEKLLRTLTERIGRVPKLSWTVRHVPLGLDRPYWVENKGVRVEDHVHRVSVPAPGGEDELAELSSQLFSRQLDRSRPLWEIWYIEGLAEQRAAILLKTHHCMFDGLSGVGLGEILADFEPNPPEEPEEKNAKRKRSSRGSQEPEPSDMELFQQGLVSLMGMPYRVTGWMAKMSWRSMAMIPHKRKHRDLLAGEAPRTIFNNPLTSRRGITFASVSLDDVKAIKKHFDVKVNDVLLAVCGSALRSYLQAQNALPEETLIAGVPISTRAEGDKNLDNQVGTLSVSLETHLKDPVKRLKEINRRSLAAKEIAGDLGATDVQAMGTALPPVAIELAGWILNSAKLEGKIPLQANTIISNVPGPPFPLYICGGKVEAVFPLAPVLVGMGLSITIMSYVKDINFGFMLDPNLVPEPWLLTEGIENGVEELKRAIEG